MGLRRMQDLYCKDSVMTPEEYRREYARIEAEANLAAGHAVSRRTGNKGRYWALGACIATLQASEDLSRIEDAMQAALGALNEAYYAQELAALDGVLP